MSEIKGYLLTKEEEEECITLIKKMREKNVFVVDFTGCVKIKAKTCEEATDIFWEWVGDMQDISLSDWSKTIVQTPHFTNDCIEEEE